MDKNQLSHIKTLFKESVSNVAILFLHGFRASPFEMKECAEYLHKTLKLTVYVPLLSYHGKQSAACLNESKWKEWYQSAEDAYIKLKENYKTIFIVGMSIGGSLTLRLAATYNPEAIICIGTPYKLAYRTAWAKFLSFFISTLNDRSGSDIADLSQKEKVSKIDKIPIYALVQLRKMLYETQSLYNDIICPILLAHSKKDHVISYRNMSILKEKIVSKKIELESYVNSYHVIPLDNDRYALFKRIEIFLKPFIATN